MMETVGTSRRVVSRLILLALGSQDIRRQKPFVALCRKLEEERGAGCVSMAYLQCGPPSLLEAVTEAVDAGINHVVILPLFLTLGDEVEQSIPRQVVMVKERFPDLGVVLLPPVGEHPTVAEAILTVARASCAL